MAKLTITRVKDAIERARGNITTASKSLNVSRTSIYKFLKKYPQLEDCLQEEREKMIDNVESALYKQALDGNTTAMIFFLKTQGKSRGYVERQEVTGADGQGMRVIVEYANSPFTTPEVPSEPAGD